MICENNSYTISFDEKVKGWTTFHSFQPDFIIGINNDLFTFHNGNLFIHHSDKVERNVYYGKSYPSKISAILNDYPSDVKSIKAISLEGNYSWDTLIKAYISSVNDFEKSTIKDAEFIKKEGIWYAYARRNEDSKQTDSKSLYGIGKVEKIESSKVFINGYSDTMTAGDTLVKGTDLIIVGIIKSISRDDKTTIIEIDSNDLNVGDFVCGMKDSRIEGGNLRGYSIRIDLEIYKPDKVELFAINAEVNKSYQ